MRAVVVYESMYGNTHAVASEIAEGMRRARPTDEVDLVPVSEASVEVLQGADLVVVGGPTHMHGVSWSSTRNTARNDAAKHDGELELDPDAPDSHSPGLRDWFHLIGNVDGVAAAAFDTRFDASPAFTGRASRGITHKLHHHGYHTIVEPESFLIDKNNHLVAGETDRARAWGESVMTALGSPAAH